MYYSERLIFDGKSTDFAGADAISNSFIDQNVHFVPEFVNKAMGQNVDFFNSKKGII